MTGGVLFSQALIREYQAEMAAIQGVAVSANDAQEHLRSLVRCLFGDGAGAGTLVRHRATEVGDSITP
ncbi:MAG: hypothetical protein ABIT47_03300, partial [Candidatus Paceibacterota bacterium]